MSQVPLAQKFHSVDPIVDTVERRSKYMNARMEFYTMQDIVDTVGNTITIESAADPSTIYNSASFMAADAALTAGNLVETRGYTTAGDGGAAVYVISASGVADGGNVIALGNGLFAITDFGGITCPTQWGAVKNDTSKGTVNSAAFNAMFLYMATIGGEKCSVSVSTGTYSLAASVLLPQALTANEDTFLIDFNGSELLAEANTMTLLLRNYNSGQESSKVSVLNVNFNGGGHTGVTGIDIQGGYNCQIINCEFNSLSKGIELGFALNSHIYNCKFTYCLRGCDIGLLGGTNTNGQSNVSTMHKCRFYSATTTDYALHIDRVSGVVVMDCIFEGNQPTGANIYFDGQSSVVNDCSIIGCHAESAGHATSGHNTHVYFTGGARLKVYNVFAQVTTNYVVPAAPVNGREIIHVAGGNAYTDLSMYYWTSAFSIRNDTNGGFYMTDTQLNTTLPNNMNTDPIQWTGTIGEPLYFAIERANDGIATSRGRAIRTSDTGGGKIHEHFLKAAAPGEVDVLKAYSYESWIGSYEGNVGRTVYGRSFYQPVAFDQQVVFTNDDYIVGTTTHGDLKTPPSSKINAVTMELEAGETGRYDQTLCPASGRPTVYTATAIPALASSAGKKGEIRSDATHMYICTADNTWIKSALVAF